MTCIDELMKLPECSDIDHVFTFQLKAKLLFDDHHNVNKIKAVDAKIGEGVFFRRV